MVSFPGLSILPLQGVNDVNVSFIFGANDSVTLVSIIEFRAKACRTGSVSAAVGGCQKCTVGFYAVPGDEVCRPCAFGALCAGGRDFPGGMGIYAKPNFWQPLWQREGSRRYAAVSFTPIFYSCPFMGACVGESKCADAYTGVLIRTNPY